MDLATVDKWLTTTRTVRKRLDFTRPVAPEILQACLEITIQAPTVGMVGGRRDRRAMAAHRGEMMATVHSIS